MKPVHAGQARYSEEFVTYGCHGSTCVGVVSRPTSGAGRSLAVVIVVGGPQYRVGSHRQFTRLARALAQHGYPVLRFDYRGMGDSEGDPRSFDDLHDDLAAAVDACVGATGRQQVALWGLCDGASAALMYAASDPRIATVVALNPWVRTSRSLASVRLRHYYAQRFFSADFWRRMLSGKVNMGGAVHGVTDILRTQGEDASGDGYLARMHAGWRNFARPVMFLLSGQDLTAREFESWIAASPPRRELLGTPQAALQHVADADHTFSTEVAHAAMVASTLEWLDRSCPAS